MGQAVWILKRDSCCACFKVQDNAWKDIRRSNSSISSGCNSSDNNDFHRVQVYKMPCVSLRLFNVYGPRSRTTGAYGAVFKVFLAQKLAGKPYTVVGDGTQTRDFVFVTDVARAFLLAAESGKTHETYNVGAAKPQSVNRLVELLGGSKVHIPKRPGEPDCTWADTSKIQKELKWVPRVSFEEGVAVMLKKIDHWRDAPVWDPGSIEKVTENWFKMLTKEQS